MNIAIIFAGGTGQRMNIKTLPKQFLELYGKPIIVYTVEQFQKHPQINKIIIVMLESWIDYTKKLVDKYGLTKVVSVVQGGITGQGSIFNGLKEAKRLFPEDSVVLIHDGVRPLIDRDTISKNIDVVNKKHSAITVSSAIETVVIKSENCMIGDIIERSCCQFAKAPQSFFLKDIWSAHCKAIKEGKMDFIDSACLMKYYGFTLYTVEGLPENIKITTPNDFYTFRALEDARENSQIFG